MKRYSLKKTNAALFLFLLISVTATAQRPPINWAARLGGAGGDVGNSVAIDAAGNIYVAGTYNGTSDFDPAAGTANLTAVGGNDIFLASYDSAGAYRWAISVGGDRYDEAYHVITDVNGDVYITGVFRGTADFDPSPANTTHTSIGESDIFLAKYDAAGNYLWANRMGGTSFDAGQYLASDASGNIYLTGDFQGTARFDPTLAVDELISQGGTDIYIAKYTGNGTCLWAKGLGNFGFDGGYRMTESKGALYVAGTFSGTVDFNPSAATTELTAEGMSDVFIARYDTGGHHAWTRKIGSIAGELVTGIAPDGQGGVCLTGTFSDTVVFGPVATRTELYSDGQYDVFVSRYDRAGNCLWAKGFGGNGDDMSTNMAADNGQLYISGYFRNPMSFGGSGTLTAAGEVDAFVVGYDTTGQHSWAIAMGGPQYDFAHSVAKGAGGEMYVTGYFAETAGFGRPDQVITLVSEGLSDVFLAKYRPGKAPLGRVEVYADAAFSIYPNPGTGSFYLSSEGPGNRHVAVYNSMGVLVSQQLLPGTGMLDLSLQPAGVYFVQLHDGNNVLETRKLVKE